MDIKIIFYNWKLYTCHVFETCRTGDLHRPALPQVTILRKFPGIFHRKIRQLFPGISCNPFWRTRSEEFLATNSEEFLVTHSEEILITLSKEFLVTNSREFLVTNYAENVGKFCENSWEFPAKSSSEPIPGNFLGTIPKIFSRVPQEYLKLFSTYSWVNSLTRT